MSEKTVFQTMREYDITNDLKVKNNLNYLPWSSAWGIIKELYPTATYNTVKTDNGCIYHTDGKTCWVETSLTIEGETQNETLAVMNFKNQSISADTVASTDVNKSLKRCLTKNAALFGLGLSLWNGEELSEAAKKAKDEKSKEDIAVAAELATKKEEIIALAASKKDAGVDATQIYAVIVKYTGKKNPNALSDIETANKVYDEINNMGVNN